MYVDQLGIIKMAVNLFLLFFFCNSTAFFPILTQVTLFFFFDVLNKEHYTHLYPKKINFDAVDFSARHSKEAMFHLTLSAVFLTSFNPLYITAMYKKNYSWMTILLQLLVSCNTCSTLRKTLMWGNEHNDGTLIHVRFMFDTVKG